MARFLAPASVQGAVLGLDLYLLALAAAVLFPPLACSGRGTGDRLKLSLSVLVRAPGRILGTAAVLLAWAVLLAGLFPASVPLSLAVGFWPPALLSAQVFLPPLRTVFGRENGPDAACEPAPASERDLTAGQRAEILWRRRWPLILGIVIGVSLLAGALGTLMNQKDPDLQIAIVHTQPLPDGVRSALEDSLAALVGDRNGDGRALAQVNDYTVAFGGGAVERLPVFGGPGCRGIFCP